MGHIQNLLRRPGECSSGFMPAPLLLDAQGRQIDESGKVVEEKISNQTSTLKANKGTSRTSQNPYLLSIDKQDKLETLDPRLKLMKRDMWVTCSRFNKDFLLEVSLFYFIIDVHQKVYHLSSKERMSKRLSGFELKMPKKC
jgi:hypothetical protein